MLDSDLRPEGSEFLDCFGAGCDARFPLIRLRRRRYEHEPFPKTVDVRRDCAVVPLRFRPAESGGRSRAGETALEHWLSGRNAAADFRGEKRSNETHQSTTAPEARLYRKGSDMEARLCFIGHTLMENRSGLLVDACLSEADGHAERVAALHMIEPHADRPRPITLGGDKGFDTADFVNELRSMNVTPHVAQNTSNRRSAIDGRTTRHGGYQVSQRIRKRIEEAFGWIKTVAGQRKTRFRGVGRVGIAFTFAAAAYNLVRLPKLLAEAG